MRPMEGEDVDEGGEDMGRRVVERAQFELWRRL